MDITGTHRWPWRLPMLQQQLKYCMKGLSPYYAEAIRITHTDKVAQLLKLCSSEQLHNDLVENAGALLTNKFAKTCCICLACIRTGMRQYMFIMYFCLLQRIFMWHSLTQPCRQWNPIGSLRNKNHPKEVFQFLTLEKLVRFAKEKKLALASTLCSHCGKMAIVRTAQQGERETALPML